MIIIGVPRRETCIVVHVYGQVRMQARMLQRRVGYRAVDYRKDHRQMHSCNNRQAPRTGVPQAGKSQGFISMGWRGVTRGVAAFAKIADSSAFISC